MLVMPRALVHLLDQPQDHPEGDRVQADEGLVVDEHFRVHDDGAGERHAARHAAGELRGHQLRGAAQAHGLQLGQHQRCAPAPRAGRCARAPGRRRSRTPSGRSAARRSGTACRCAGAARTPRGCPRPAEVLAEGEHLALVGADLRGQQAQQRRLAGAARPHDRGDAPAAHAQGQPVRRSAGRRPRNARHARRTPTSAALCCAPGGEVAVFVTRAREPLFRRPGSPCRKRSRRCWPGR